MKLSSDKKILTYTTTSDDAGKRLDVVSRSIFTFLSLSQIFQGIRKGKIKINQEKKPLNYRLNNHDTLSFESIFPIDQLYGEFYNTLESTQERLWTSQEIERYQSLEILLEDANFVIVNKPTRWISHGKFPSLTDWLAWRYPPVQSSSFRMSPVHRLDVGSSGLIVLAKTTQGARYFQQAQEANQLKKLYLAFVDGTLSKDIHSQLHLTRHNQKTYVHEKPSAESKLAITHIYPIASVKNKSLIACVIETGRTHQIRAVSAHYGHPLVGDMLYNPDTKEKTYFLHSFLLENKALFSCIIQAPVPAHFEQVLKKYQFNISRLFLLERYTILLE